MFIMFWGFFCIKRWNKILLTHIITSTSASKTTFLLTWVLHQDKNQVVLFAYNVQEVICTISPAHKAISWFITCHMIMFKPVRNSVWFNGKVFFWGGGLSASSFRYVFFQTLINFCHEIWWMMVDEFVKLKLFFFLFWELVKQWISNGLKCFSSILMHYLRKLWCK